MGGKNDRRERPRNAWSVVKIFCAIVVASVALSVTYESNNEVFGVKLAAAAAKSASKSAPDYYKVLGVSKKATTSEIGKKYRALSKQYHPDLNKSDANAQEKFTQVAEAYEVLQNTEERAKFDQLGPERYQEQKQGRGGGDEDFWEFPFSFFGGGGGRRRGKERPATVKLKLHVTLEQLYFGDLLHVTFRRPVLCVHVDECSAQRRDCVGEGTKVVHQQVGPGFMVQNHVPDATCVGAGKGWKKNCSKCPHGATEMEKTHFTAYVEPGMHTGDTLDFPGSGWQALGQEPGDLVLVIAEEASSKMKSLERQGSNLYTEVTVTLLEALVGFTKEIPHISGTNITLSREQVTADGEVEVLSGKGMPILGEEGKYGDLLVKLMVHYPMSLDVGQKESIRAGLKDVYQWKHVVSQKAA